MPGLNSINLDPTKPPGGGGPEDENRSALYQLRMQGFIVIVCGFAVGLTLLILLALFRKFGAPLQILNDWVNDPTLEWWQVFLTGLIAGTIFSAIYNLLVVRRLYLFGYEREVD
jgi:hypothetical protein